MQQNADARATQDRHQSHQYILLMRRNDAASNAWNENNRQREREN